MQFHHEINFTSILRFCQIFLRIFNQPFAFFAQMSFVCIKLRPIKHCSRHNQIIILFTLLAYTANGIMQDLAAFRALQADLFNLILIISFVKQLNNT